MVDFSVEGSFRFFLETQLSTGWMATEFSSGFFGIIYGATADEATESWILACRMPLLLDDQSPDDVLPYVGRDRRLPRYTTETAANHRDRLYNAWEIYLAGGSVEAIETQILEAGWGPDTFIGDYGNPDVTYGDAQYVYGDLGAFVEFRPDSPGPRGEAPPYKTQFWVVFSPGFHPVTGPPLPWGSFNWGDTHTGVWGPQGYSREFAKDMTDLVKKWKHSNHVFRGFRFIVNDVLYGDPDISYGDTSIQYGGNVFDVPIY